MPYCDFEFTLYEKDKTYIRDVTWNYEPFFPIIHNIMKGKWTMVPGLLAKMDSRTRIKESLKLLYCLENRLWNTEPVYGIMSYDMKREIANECLQSLSNLFARSTDISRVKIDDVINVLLHKTHVLDLLKDLHILMTEFLQLYDFNRGPYLIMIDRRRRRRPIRQ